MGNLHASQKFVQQILEEQYKGNVQGKEAVITVTAIRNEYGVSEVYGYEFASTGTYSKGQVIQNEDGSITRIAAIL